MYNRKKVFVIVAVLLLIISLLVVSVPPAKAQFVLASWDYPDDYGQGIKRFVIYENSTGSWVQVGDYLEYNDDNEVQWNDSRYIKLRCVTLLNGTLTGAVDADDGKRYLRHTVNVTTLGETVFSQQNFTYVSGSPEAYGMYIYSYDVILNFLPVGGNIYTVNVIYEVFYGAVE